MKNAHYVYVARPEQDVLVRGVCYLLNNPSNPWVWTALFALTILGILCK